MPHTHTAPPQNRTLALVDTCGWKQESHTSAVLSQYTRVTDDRQTTYHNNNSHDNNRTSVRTSVHLYICPQPSTVLTTESCCRDSSCSVGWLVVFSIGRLASFVQDRTQQVIYEGKLSRTVSVPFGVPQGSVLGPLLFVLYTAELSEVVAAHGLMLHQYADDCQIYIATPVSHASSSVTGLQDCLCQADAWMSSSRLRLNHKKTEVMWLGSRQQLDKLSVHQVTVV